MPGRAPVDEVEEKEVASQSVDFSEKTKNIFIS